MSEVTFTVSCQEVPFVTRFVHTADWQLGMTRHFLSAEAQARFDGARLDAVRAIGAIAVEQGCEFVLVCGDVFETNHVARQVVVRALEAMAATPQVMFHLLPGNHDPLDASSVYRSPVFERHRPPNVAVLTGGPVTIAPGVELVAAPWRSKRPVTDQVGDAVSALGASAGVRIVVGHGAVDAMTPESSTNPALISLDALERSIEAAAIHYVALGDRHSTTQVGGTGRIWYAGAPEPTDYDETDPGNALVVDLEPGRLSVMPHRVASWRYLRHEVDLTGAADCDRLDAWLGALDDKQRSIVKVAIVGQLSLADKVRLDEILEHHADLLGALEHCQLRSNLIVLPALGDFADLGLAGFAAGALDDLRHMATRPDPSAAAGDALALLYRLAKVPA
jgi:DNA repair exonuclease SbcCD nuclease subunit